MLSSKEILPLLERLEAAGVGLPRDFARDPRTGRRGQAVGRALRTWAKRLSRLSPKALEGATAHLEQTRPAFIDVDDFMHAASAAGRAPATASAAEATCSRDLCRGDGILLLDLPVYGGSGFDSVAAVCPCDCAGATFREAARPAEDILRDWIDGDALQGHVERVERATEAARERAAAAELAGQTARPGSQGDARRLDGQLRLAQSLQLTVPDWAWPTLETQAPDGQPLPPLYEVGA